MTEVRQVSVGETSYRIGSFRGFKAELVGEIVSRSTEEVKQVLDHVSTFTREWESEHKLRITRDMCSERAANLRASAATAAKLAEKAPEEVEDVKDDELRPKTKDELLAEERLLVARAESWDQQLKDLGDKPFVEVPDPLGAPLHEQVLAAFPKAFELARTELKRLLALVAIPNAELQQADEAGRVDEALEELGKRLFYDGEIGELVELAVVAGEVIEAEYLRYRQTVGKLEALYARARRKTKPEPEEKKDESASRSESPTSPTPSPAPMDGPEERLSSASPSPSSAPSPSA